MLKSTRSRHRATRGPSLQVTSIGTPATKWPRGPLSISVVIPAYNAARFIAETLESVLAQTLLPDEILVIDDGSSDNTATIAESFGPLVRVIRRTNHGQAASRNIGVQQAASEWIAFIDSDDLWEPGKLELQMAELALHPQAGICYTARLNLIEDGGIVRGNLITPVPPPDAIGPSLHRSTTFLPSSVVIRRTAFLAIGGFNTHFRIMEDWELWLRLLNAGTEFAACPWPLLRYRVHPTSVSHNVLPALREAEEIYRTQVLPHLPRFAGWLHFTRVRSHHESSAAFTLRVLQHPACLSVMARSILRDPFHNPHRYKALAHMFYTRLTQPQPIPKIPRIN
jgi:glycosyltransferase involved in cell wall biosynthesis